MAFVRLANALVLLQLSLLLLCTSITVYGDESLAHYSPAEAPHPPPPHHHHHHPPTPPPSHPPTPPPSPPPVKPPAHPPVKPPSYPPVKPPSIIPQGRRGIDTLLGAAPLAGAVVKLQCNNTKYSLVEQAKTDKNGYFFFMPQKLTTSGFHKCKVFLVSSPLPTCSVPTNLHGGAAGAILIPTPKPPVTTPIKPPPFELFTVGPFAFEPPKKLPCHY
ncbi:hypothetical protein Pfo_012917 [Paulownia fortunei]|nr:hypothetical protein Pfo_012917 [Paulownia fortunei]